MGNLGYLFAGFAVAWAAAFVYLWTLSRRAERLRRRMDSLEDSLGRE